MPEEYESISLIEYQPLRLSRHRISEDLGQRIWKEFKGRIEVEFPTPKTDNQWELVSEGWVGHIPLTDNVSLDVQPKVPISNIFRMLEYAYRLESLEFLENLYSASSLNEFYEEFANILAKKILARGRKGYYRTYLDLHARLPFITGKLDAQTMIRKPWHLSPRCEYQEHTPDVEENQILAWTLFTIARSGQCSERVTPVIRRAYRDLQGFITLYPFSPQNCIGRFYNRLNEDYEQLHAMCRFFLENIGPTHAIGEKIMTPFLVNMADLFELFVAEWLKKNLPYKYGLKTQENVDISKDGEVKFRIDLVLYNIENDCPLFVLDTKYKAPEKASTSDLHQVIAYAQVKQCNEAILIYPKELPIMQEYNAHDIQIRTLAFSLDDDLEVAGQEFLTSLFRGVE